MVRRRLAFALVGVALAAASAHGGGSGLLPNPDFDDLDDLDVVEGWYELFPQVSEMNNILEDADGCPFSGGADGINTSNVEAGSAVYSACTNEVVAGQAYRLTGALRFPIGTSQSAATVLFSFAAQADCFGSLTTGAGLPSYIESTTTDWVAFETLPATAPEGAIGARVSIVLVKDFAADPVADVYFDKVYFTPADFVFAEDFENGSACRWSLEVAGGDSYATKVQR
jgi:hypothetical protein